MGVVAKRKTAPTGNLTSAVPANSHSQFRLLRAV
jgi:hypothetical protein